MVLLQRARVREGRSVKALAATSSAVVGGFRFAVVSAGDEASAQGSQA